MSSRSTRLGWVSMEDRVEYFILQWVSSDEDAASWNSQEPTAIRKIAGSDGHIFFELPYVDYIFSFSYSPSNDPNCWIGTCSHFSGGSAKSILRILENGNWMVFIEKNVNLEWDSEEHEYSLIPATKDDFLAWRSEVEDRKELERTIWKRSR